jgi:hypothetical protein
MFSKLCTQTPASLNVRDQVSHPLNNYSRKSSHFASGLILIRVELNWARWQSDSAADYHAGILGTISVVYFMNVIISDCIVSNGRVAGEELERIRKDIVMT